MTRVFCRPAILTSAVQLAFPMALPAKTTASDTSPTSSGNTSANAGNSGNATPSHANGTGKR